MQLGHTVRCIQFHIVFLFFTQCVIMSQCCLDRSFILQSHLFFGWKVSNLGDHLFHCCFFQKFCDLLFCMYQFS